MSHTEPFQHRTRTKTVATVGPACRHPEMLAALIQAGVDVFRVNMAHGSRSEHEQVVAAVRQASADAGRPIAILVDLAGPKIRLGELFQDPTECAVGAEYVFVRGTKASHAHELVSNYERLIDELSPDNAVMLADGTVSMTVLDKQLDSVRCCVTGGGTIRSRQGINLPGAKLSVPAMSDDDLDNAVWAATSEIDFVSLSFVRTPTEIRQLKELLRSHGSRALVIAKIEKREALENLEEIVAATDAVMVARGDLGVEIDVSQTPVMQKRIIATCTRLRRPVIVATQMLDSMHHSRRPTRAEVSDVANAILDGADACMLSGETAIGQYPREAVEMMNRIMRSTEQELQDTATSAASPAPARDVHPITLAVTYGAAQIAEHLDAKLVVISTRSGATARVKAKQRDFIPTIGVSDSEATLRQMCLYWGITPLPGAPVHDGPQLRQFIDDWGRADGCITRGDCVVFVTGSEFVPKAHNLVIVHEVE